MMILSTAHIALADRITRHDTEDEFWQRRGVRPIAWLYGSTRRYRVAAACGVVLFGCLLLWDLKAR